MLFAARRLTGLRFSISAIVLTILLALAGCSASWHAQLARGERYEQQNRPAAALAVYDAMLPLVPVMPLTVSVAVTRWVPAVVNRTALLKVWVPLSSAVNE